MTKPSDVPRALLAPIEHQLELIEELVERTVHTVRQPAEMAKGVARLGGHTRRR